MVQYTKEYLQNSANATAIINDIKPILSHRYEMYERYTKKEGIPVEAYTTKVASGYIAGIEPKFEILEEVNPRKQKIITKLFNKVFGDKSNAEEYKIMVDYINDYNDLGDFFFKTVLDYFSTGACRWLNYENKDNEQIYARIPSWQCEIIYDYSLPVQVIGAVQIFRTIDETGHDFENAIITTLTDKRYFRNSEKEPNKYLEDTDKKEDVKWNLIPFYGVEASTGALFENILTLVDKLEACIDNTSSIMEYNDLGCKLKVTGFTPENPSLIMDENGKVVLNPAREKEDNALLNAKVFYTPDATGDINWISKTIDSSAVDMLKKTLLEYILMLTFIPNITDEGFTNASSNKALMKKFFGLQTSQQETIKSLEKELLRMWENIVDRINIKKGTKFDFRDLNIQVVTCIPTDDTEVVDMWLKLRELISDETILSKLPLNIDVESEIKKKKDQDNENFEVSMSRTKQFNEGENEDLSNNNNNDKSNSANDKQLNEVEEER